MKCLTICQPWAWAIMQNAGKRIENRTWPTRYRGPLLVHAGKSREWLRDEFPDCWQRAYGLDLPDAKDMTFGAIVGIAELIDCQPREDMPRAWREHPFAEGPYCWMLSDVRRLREPIAYRGRQGLFDVPDSVIPPLESQWVEVSR